MIEILTYSFMQKALFAGILISIIIGILGPFLVLRRMSMLGDGIAHLSFGGIAIGVLFGFEPILAAFVLALLGAFFIQYSNKKNILTDSSIAVVLSFGLALGIIIISIAKGFKTDLFSYLIGSILTLSKLDLILITLVFILTLIYVYFNYKSLIFQSFNEELYEISTVKTKLNNFLFTVIITSAIIIGVKAVGILLITGLIVIPTITALNISKSFKQTIVYATLISMFSIIFGIIGSYYLNIAPSGMIIMTLILIYLITLIFKK